MGDKEETPTKVGDKGDTTEKEASSKLEHELQTETEEIPLPKLIKTTLVRLYFKALIYAYYREVDVIGTEHVPRSGPVIFCGNHQNQFVDGMMLFTYCPRMPSFLIAEASMSRPVVGHVARFLNAIPVKRHQDTAVKGTGCLTDVERTCVRGVHTRFKEKAAAGGLIRIDVSPPADDILPRPHTSLRTYTCVTKILEVVSDTELKLRDLGDEAMREIEKRRGPSGQIEESSYMLMPKIEQKEMWQSVYDTLSRGGSIGIFPEGGSHDKTKMIGMKDGVARFALGHMEHGGEAPVIIPVGLTYYYGHRFRSRAHVEFGKPMNIENELFQTYLKDDKQGIKLFMGQLKEAMEGVTINAPNWESLKKVHYIRRLYQPQNLKLPVDEYLRITRNFAHGLQIVEGRDEAKTLMKRLDCYQDLLKAYLLTDYQVQTLTSLRSRTSYRLLLSRMLSTSLYFLLALPGIFINLPLGVSARVYADIKSEEAVRKSSVKDRGNDVKASYKLICAVSIAPFYILSFAAVAWWWFGSFGMAVIVAIMYPVWSYWSVVWAYNCMVSARATFPLLLSLHSEKYFHRFEELHHFRQALTRDVRTLIDTKIRGKFDFWSSQSEVLYNRIAEASDSFGSPAVEGFDNPFAVEHTSRVRSPAAFMPSVVSGGDSPHAPTKPRVVKRPAVSDHSDIMGVGEAEKKQV
ncbi:Glycerol-3-phosphate O-acyltransferase 1 [Diplonema papillatum]|nr:Glycerol-3-phosphate O-acyltransferase 1 [Diplonema papillatum]